MSNNDEAARKARAQRLREQLSRLKSAETPPPPDDQKKGVGQQPEPAAPRRESPREFIHRRMQELDAPKKAIKKGRKR
jgi:hypothetical protein